MAKLYWRVKRDGKWTWKAAMLDPQFPNEFLVIPLEELE
jgi:hypothetical protein